ncbi:MAG: DUF5711 family protein [Clostridiales bacterium]|nr:DUF5711 family protein [Lachnospiraceae bacterium]MDD6618047.1 DUF5711 family protein [Clostridiales bacterium]
MSNVISNLKRKMRKRRALKNQRKLEKNIRAATNDDTSYDARLARHRRKVMIRTGITAGVIVMACIGTALFVKYRSYDTYKVISTSDNEDTVSAQYLELDGSLFKYSGDGVAVQDYEGNISWSATYEMQNPIADECDGTIAVADQGGTNICIFNKDGEIGQIETTLNIVKVKVAKQGVVAAILDGGEDTWINFYASDGSLIAENQTRVDDPGYPLDIAVSEDGVLIMVAYQFVSGEETTSYVAFYNFATAGQNQIDNIVSGYQYQGVVIPQVEYLDSSTAVAFRDDGFSVFKGKQIPKESANVQVEEEIISTFYDKDNIGLVFKNDGKDKMYTMKVYDTSGHIKFEKSFNIAYTKIRMSDGHIVMNNDSQVCVITTNGVEKFNGNIDEGAINDFFRLGMNKYMLVMDNGLSTIKFK